MRVLASGRARRGGVRTKPRQAMTTPARALDGRVPFFWVTSYDVYGPMPLRASVTARSRRRARADNRGERHRDHHRRRTTAGRGTVRRNARVSMARLSTGASAHGPRDYDWARSAVRQGLPAGHIPVTSRPPDPMQKHRLEPTLWHSSSQVTTIHDQQHATLQTTRSRQVPRQQHQLTRTRLTPAFLTTDPTHSGETRVDLAAGPAPRQENGRLPA